MMIEGGKLKVWLLHILACFGAGNENRCKSCFLDLLRQDFINFRINRI